MQVFSGLAAERKIDESTRHAFLLILLEATSEMLTKGFTAKGPKRELASQLCSFLGQVPRGAQHTHPSTHRTPCQQLTECASPCRASCASGW